MGGVPAKSRIPMPTAHGGPPLGWIRMMREARGLSLRQLAARLGIQGNSVHVAERREATGGISLYQLQRIADALECDLFYAFVPRRTAKTRRPRAESAETAPPRAPASPP